MAEDPLGMPELREVIHRLHEQSRYPDEQMLSPDDVTAIAHHLYHGTNDGTRMTNPGYWSHLASIRDPNTTDIDPISAQIRQKQWQGWTGPGWSPEERAALGRDPEGFELSPGDRTSHQWMRDSQYLNDVLGRNQTVNTGELPSSVTAWGGSSGATHDQQAQRKLEEALHWYKRGENATHSVTPSIPGTIAGLVAMGHGTSNFKKYSDLGGFFDASDNPDYAFGHLTTQYMDPLGYAVQKQTMRDPTAKESQYWQDVRNSWTPAAILPPVYDFFRNALSDKSTIQDAIEVARGAQFNRHSPKLPATSSGMSAEDRVRELQRLRAANAGARNMDFDSYHYGKTGQLPSKAGSMGGSIAAQAIDPSILVTGLGAKAVGSVLGKNVTTAAAMAGEMAEDFFPNVALTTALATVPFDHGQGTKPVPFKDWLTPGDEARTDVPSESHQDRMARIQSHEGNQDAALDVLRKANKAAPRPVNKSTPSGSYMNSGFKT